MILKVDAGNGLHHWDPEQDAAETAFPQPLEEAGRERHSVKGRVRTIGHQKQAVAELLWRLLFLGLTDGLHFNAKVILIPCCLVTMCDGAALCPADVL